MRNSNQSLEGAWSVALTFNQDGLPLCAPSPAVATSDGNILAESCFASESTGYGSWTRIGNREFAITFIGNSFGQDGLVAFKYKVRAQVRIGDQGEMFTGRFRTDIFDLTDTLKATFTGRLHATRVEVEPLN